MIYSSYFEDKEMITSLPSNSLRKSNTCSRATGLTSSEKEKKKLSFLSVCLLMPELPLNTSLYQESIQALERSYDLPRVCPVVSKVSSKRQRVAGGVAEVQISDRVHALW